jgi:hypothetical protein
MSRIYFNIATALMSVFVIVPLAAADAWETIRNADAQRAAGLVKTGDIVVSYCPTCNGILQPYTFRAFRIQTVRVEKTHPTYDESSVVVRRDVFMSAVATGKSSTETGVMDLTLASVSCSTKTRDKEASNSGEWSNTWRDEWSNDEPLSCNYHFLNKVGSNLWAAFGTYVVSQYPPNYSGIYYTDSPNPAVIRLNEADSKKIKLCLIEYDTAECPTRFATTGIVSGLDVELRKTPEIGSSILRTVPRTTNVQLLETKRGCSNIAGRTGQWVRVRVNDSGPITEGWMFDSYLR